MWEIFLILSFLFFSLGFIEFKKHKKKKYKEYTHTKTSVKMIVESPKPNEDNRRVIPLDLGSGNSNSLKIGESNITENKISVSNEIPNPKDIQERKKLWEDYWIVKKVRERFENKKPTSSVGSSSIEAPPQDHNTAQESSQTPSQNNVFASLLKERESANEESFNNVPFEGSAPQNNETDKKRQEKKKEEEKEFNPFDMFG